MKGYIHVPVMENGVAIIVQVSLFAVYLEYCSIIYWYIIWCATSWSSSLYL